MRSSRLIAVSVVALIVGPSCDCSKNVSVENAPVIRIDSNELDFGPVTEFTDAGRPIVVRNVGRAPLTISSVSIESDGGTEFTVMSMPSSIDVSGSANIDIDFSPLGSGEDFAVAVIRSDDPEQPEIRVTLHGGPIYPYLDFDPDGGFLAFAPTSMQLTSKYALLRSVGGSTLTVTGVGVAQNGNPDFSVVRPTLPAVLRPGQSIPVQVDYARSSRTEEGLMTVNSDDWDAGRKALRLLPDPAPQCGDGLDNDMDGLADFPDDPGCSSVNDADEFNDPECVNGATRSCGVAIGICRPGVQNCMLGAWYPCDGGIKMRPETCNGLDDNCDGDSDEDITELCTINGCPGVRLCTKNSGVDGGAFSACQPIMMSPETCNGVDDDCDGMIDEGIITTCMINGCTGTRLCIPGGDGGFTACNPANPATETCNNIDDDCDGTVDDVQPALQTCGSGVCARTAPACVDGGIPVCMPGMPATEICNGIDDDCDGTPDDNLGTSSCGTGACFRTVPACMPDGGMGVCVPGMQTAETCNNIDDDCDGPVDEMLTRSCYTGPSGTAGIGPCVAGTQTCSMGAWGASCPGEVTPATEVCNNVNDDCDSATDEAPDGGPLSVGCYDGGPPATRNVGRCRDGVSTCSGGAYGNCVGQIGPIAEVCGNSIDEACNGNADEVCPTDGGPCDINGTWRVDGGNIAYSCSAFGIPLVTISISQFIFGTNSPSAGTMTAAPQFTWSPGPTYNLRGPNASCPSGAMNVSSLYAGTCDEAYRLQGNFTGPNSFQGTFTMTFTGSCFSCTSQTFGVQLFRQ